MSIHHSYGMKFVFTTHFCILFFFFAPIVTATTNEAQVEATEPPTTTPAPDNTTTNGNKDVTLTIIIRDFKFWNSPSFGHPDFNQASGVEKGIVTNNLSSDRKPVYNPRTLGWTTHGAQWFNMWYRPSNYSKLLQNTIVLKYSQSFPTPCYNFGDTTFFPIDNKGWGNQGVDDNNVPHNFAFTVEISTTFTYSVGQWIAATGDDDVWVFINNYLVVDLGGVHLPLSQTVVLQDIARQVGLTYGNTYAINIFYAERHVTRSTFILQTNIVLHDCAVVDACGYCNGAATGNLCANKDCGQGTCDCKTGCCVCNSGWAPPSGNCSACTMSCGDGIQQLGEDCDIPNPADPNYGCCDLKTCKFSSTSTTCKKTSDNECQTNQCNGKGVCVVKDAVNNTCTPTTPSQCLINVCAAGGVCGIPQRVNTTCGSTAPSSCSYSSCAADGTCKQTTLPPGSACPGSYVASCVSWQCSTSGACAASPLPRGTPCPSDGNPCTTENCDGTGNCVSTLAVTCNSPPSQQCFNPNGTCNPSNGNCVYTQKAINATCTPGTSNPEDVCSDFACDSTGSCVGTSTDCTLPNPICFSDPHCDTTGECTYTTTTPCCGNGILEEGEVCDDLYGCCNPDCQSFTTVTGPCDDENPCTINDRCLIGFCVVDDAPVGFVCGEVDECSQATCDASGKCVPTPLDGAPCSAYNGDPCTQGVCSGGACLKVEKPANTVCGNATTQCTEQICISGVCNTVAAEDGSVCSTDKCGDSVCNSFGICVPSVSYMSCPPVDQCHTAGSCNPGTGNCTTPMQPDGIACTPPANATCRIWICNFGTCAPNCAQVSVCGNGLKEQGEDCDLGGNATRAAQLCCVNCKFAPSGAACLPDNDTCTLDVCDNEGACSHEKNETLSGCAPDVGSSIIIIIISTCGGVAVVVAGGSSVIVFLKGADMHHWVEFTFGGGQPNPLYQPGGSETNPLFTGGRW